MSERKLRLYVGYLFFVYRNHAVSPINQLLLTLRFFASGAFIICASDFCGVDKGTASRIIKKVSEAIARLGPAFISFPETEREINQTQQGFYRIASFPRVVGAIDCTHVPIKSPGGDNAEEYRGRDGKFSVNVQTVCNAGLKIMDIVSRWPGAVHDQTIFNNSGVKARFEQGQMGNLVLLGDSGYALTNYLLTPFLQPRTPGENLFNESHIRTRNTVERSYGVWKRRFPVLANTIRLKLDRVEAIIVACAVLHNIAIDMKEEEPPICPDIQQAIDQAIAAERQQIGGEGVVHNNATRECFVQYFTSLL